MTDTKADFEAAEILATEFNGNSSRRLERTALTIRNLHSHNRGMWTDQS